MKRTIEALSKLTPEQLQAIRSVMTHAKQGAAVEELGNIIAEMVAPKETAPRTKKSKPAKVETTKAELQG